MIRWKPSGSTVFSHQGLLNWPISPAAIVAVASGVKSLQYVLLLQHKLNKDMKLNNKIK